MEAVQEGMLALVEAVVEAKVVRSVVEAVEKAEAVVVEETAGEVAAAACRLVLEVGMTVEVVMVVVEQAMVVVATVVAEEAVAEVAMAVVVAVVEGTATHVEAATMVVRLAVDLVAAGISVSRQRSSQDKRTPTARCGLAYSQAPRPHSNGCQVVQWRPSSWGMSIRYQSKPNRHDIQQAMVQVVAEAAVEVE